MTQSLEQHVEELRNRLLHSLIVLGVLTGVSFYFSGDILALLQTDLGMTLNALVAYEVFYTELMIALIFGFMLSLPVFIFHALNFMKPGLKEVEYRTLKNYLPFSVLLFGVGAVFAYEVIVKASLKFFQATTEASTVGAVWGLKNTLGFALKLSVFSGLMFQLPIIAVILAMAGLIDRDMMRRYRAYFFVAVLLLAAVATPPDILTQLLLTIPVMGLYQLSIFLVGRVQPEK